MAAVNGQFLNYIRQRSETMAPFSIATEMTKLTPDAFKAVQVNLIYLSSFARGRGYPHFELRDDSRLAYLWATYQLNETAEYVVDEMAAAQWIHSSTPYGEDLETNLRRIANALKSKYGAKLTWTACWNIVRSLAPDALKASAIERVGGLPQLRFPGHQAPCTSALYGISSSTVA